MYLAPETVERRKGGNKVNRYTDKVWGEALIHLCSAEVPADRYVLTGNHFLRDVRTIGKPFNDADLPLRRCWPIKTRMERLELLRAIRRPDIVLPTGWRESDTAKQRQSKIVRWCLAHDPTKRASPLDLLRSDLLPPAVQDEYITDTLALLGKCQLAVSHTHADTSSGSSTQLAAYPDHIGSALCCKARRQASAGSGFRCRSGRDGTQQSLRCDHQAKAGGYLHPQRRCRFQSSSTHAIVRSV